MAAPVDTLGPSAYLEAMATAARVLEDHAVALDRLDRPGGAEPVDGSTRPGVGSDLAAALSRAVSAADGCSDFASISTSLHLGAREGGSGPAGRKVALLLSGMSDALRNADRLDAQRFALGLEAGAELLAPDDDGRHPGGFAAVAAVAADSALSSSDRGAELGETILAAAGAGIEELERGPENDPRLAARGTVDAGAAGLLLMLDTLASVVTGEPIPERPPDAVTVRGDVSDAIVFYDVRCRLIPDEGGIEIAANLEELLVQLAEVLRWDVGGDSWVVGLRTAAPGAVIEALVEVGRPRELHVGLSPEASIAESGRPTVSGGPLLGTAG